VDLVGGEGRPVARPELDRGVDRSDPHPPAHHDHALGHAGQVGLGPVDVVGLHPGLVDLGDAAAAGRHQQPAAEVGALRLDQDPLVGPLDLHVGLVGQDQLAEGDAQRAGDADQRLDARVAQTGLDVRQRRGADRGLGGELAQRQPGPLAQPPDVVAESRNHVGRHPTVL
jgi:hypothetical protein